VYHIFNSLPWERREIVPVTVWDYEGDFSQIAARDTAGRALVIQAGEKGNYWGHSFNTLLAEVTVPAGGYTSVIIEEKPDYTQKTSFANDMRVQSPDTFILENDLVRVLLNSLDGSIASFIDTQSGADLTPPQGGFGIFRLAQESIHKAITNWNGGMSAWFVGRYKQITPITGGIEITPLIQGPLRTAYKLKGSFGKGSALEVTVSLEAGSKRLQYEVTCDWREFGSEDAGGVPNLHFYLPLAYKGAYRFDVPFGMTKRESVDMDLPAESFVLAQNPAGPASLALFSRDKYGFRCREDSLSLTLIRGAYDPDPTPETGRHRIAFAAAPVTNDAVSNAALIRESLAYRHPMTVISGKNHGGTRAPAESLLELRSGSVVLSAVKCPEAGGKRLLLRVYETDGKTAQAEFALGFAASAAYYTDATEREHLGDCIVRDGGRTLVVEVPSYSVRAVIVELGA
jgi:alpha-mannosidase